MSEKNKEIIEKVNAAFENNNPEGFLDACSEDVEWTMVGDQSFKGKTAIREFMSQMEGMEPPKFSVDKMVAEGDSVICYGDMTMKGEDGVEGKYSYCDAYTFTGDEIRELRSFVVKHKTKGESSEKAAA